MVQPLDSPSPSSSPIGTCSGGTAAGRGHSAIRGSDKATATDLHPGPSGPRFRRCEMAHAPTVRWSKAPADRRRCMTRTGCHGTPRWQRLMAAPHLPTSTSRVSTPPSARGSTHRAADPPAQIVESRARDWPVGRPAWTQHRRCLGATTGASGGLTGGGLQRLATRDVSRAAYLMFRTRTDTDDPVLLQLSPLPSSPRIHHQHAH